MGGLADLPEVGHESLSRLDEHVGYKEVKSNKDRKAAACARHSSARKAPAACDVSLNSVRRGPRTAARGDSISNHLGTHAIPAGVAACSGSGRYCGSARVKCLATDRSGSYEDLPIGRFRGNVADGHCDDDQGQAQRNGMMCAGMEMIPHTHWRMAGEQ